jgi:hypothetical protein
MGTFLHTRAFLSYHGHRFEEASVVLRDTSGRLVGVMPAAVDPANPRRVSSHPGATFGGIVHDGRLGGAAMLHAVNAVTEHYRDRGFQRLLYAPVPSIYHQRPSGDDLYAMFRAGAERTRCDLASTLDLEAGASFSSRRRRGLAKAGRAGVEVIEGGWLVDEFWPVLLDNLRDRHGARPTHTAAEMRSLVALFPEQIAVVVGRCESTPVAGVVLFDNARVSHMQYIAATPAGRKLGALDAVLDYCITRAATTGARFFDMGTSNREAGRVLNEGLHDFKSEFGGGGVAYEHYELAFSAATPEPLSP